MLARPSIIPTFRVDNEDQLLTTKSLMINCLIAEQTSAIVEKNSQYLSFFHLHYLQVYLVVRMGIGIAIIL